jgi:uncharacterized damage-inducible protein DinB
MRTMTDADRLVEGIRRESRRRLIDESLPRLRKCLAELSDDEIWFRPNEESNSVGNLVLHLSGNVGQYILSGLGGAPDRRERPREFSERGPVPREELLGRLERTMEAAARVIDGLDARNLLETRVVQGFDYDGLGILIHVVEHFSYHTGQVAYFVKARKGIDLGFYRGVNLNRTGGGGSPERRTT